MADRTFIVRFKAREIAPVAFLAERAETQGEHLVLLEPGGRIVALFVTEVVESWCEIQGRINSTENLVFAQGRAAFRFYRDESIRDHIYLSGIMRVLCVGPDLLNLATLVTMLLESNFRASGCSVDRAAEMLRERAFDFILLPAEIESEQLAHIRMAASAEVVRLEKLTLTEELRKLLKSAEERLLRGKSTPDGPRHR